MKHSQATRAAKELLRSLEIKQHPIDVRLIAKKLNISVLEVPHEDEDLSGLILKDNENILIGVNESHSENRKRFTIAHEIGHFILHKNKDVFVDRQKNLFLRYRKKTGVYNPEESDANAFAAELLMPEKRIKEDFLNIYRELKKRLGKLENYHYDFIIKSLAEKFMVSVEAMNIRIENLRHA